MSFGDIDPPFNTAYLTPNATAAGTTQATATPLDALISIVTTVPPGSGVQVIRPAYFQQTIINSGANPLNVYPLLGMALFPAAVNVPITVQPGRTLGLVVLNDAQGYVLFNSSSFG